MALIGCAGALRRELAAGDLIVASAVLDEQGRAAPCLPLPLPGARLGPSITVSAPALTPTDKAAAAAAATACAGPEAGIAVEMEAYPLAAWAAARGLPFVHARVILDRWDDELPDLQGTLDAMGCVRPARLARRLAARPALVPGLLRLAAAMRAITPQLASLARDLAVARWPVATEEERPRA